MSNVNYAAPPFDVAEYPMSNDTLLRAAMRSPHSRQIVPGAITTAGSMRLIDLTGIHKHPLRVSSLRSHSLSTHHLRLRGVTSLSTATTVRRFMANISEA